MSPEQSSGMRGYDTVETTNELKTPPEKVTCWQQVADGVLDVPMRQFAITAVRTFGRSVASKITLSKISRLFRGGDCRE